MKKLVLAGIYLTGIYHYVNLCKMVACNQFNLFSMAAKKLSL